MWTPELAKMANKRYRERHPERVREHARKNARLYRERHPDRLLQYNRELHRRRRTEWIAANGPCARCGSSEQLEVDHKDRATKTIKTCNIWRASKAIRETELAKCQVLCRRCHSRKTGEELRAGHGSTASYRRGCRCEVCASAFRQRRREQYHARKARSADA